VALTDNTASCILLHLLLLNISCSYPERSVYSGVGRAIRLLCRDQRRLGHPSLSPFACFSLCLPGFVFVTTPSRHLFNWKLLTAAQNVARSCTMYVNLYIILTLCGHRCGRVELSDPVVVKLGFRKTHYHSCPERPPKLTELKFLVVTLRDWPT